MNWKDLLSSKSAWTGMGFIGYGVVLVITGDQQDGFKTIGEGLALIFIRSAIGHK